MTTPIPHWSGPGPAALALGRVVHHRSAPAEHRFTYPMTQIWIDPDRPDELFTAHRLWSHRGPAPARFRARDYLDDRVVAGPGTTGLGRRVRQLLARGLDRTVAGPLRMLTQPRIWGWLFNPITVYLAWEEGEAGGEGAPDGVESPSGAPVAALLEVTNTPWKERHCYPVALQPDGPDLTARFGKELHVSPFLDLHRTYTLRLHRRESSMLDLALDVYPSPDPAQSQPTQSQPSRSEPTEAGPILRTRLTTRLHPVTDPATPKLMSAALRPDQLPTHRVSLGIHRQALALWRRGIPFVPHPSRAR